MAFRSARACASEKIDPIVTVDADVDALAAINETDRALKANAITPIAQQAIVAQLADGFIAVTATYGDGTTVERNYALAVHETDTSGDIDSYRLEDVTQQ